MARVASKSKHPQRPVRRPRSHATDTARVVDRGEQTRVQIELTRRQIEDVLRAVTGEGTFGAMFAGLRGAPEVVEANPAILHDRDLSRSLLRGLLVLASCPEWVAVNEVARGLSLSASIAHRYMATLLAAGLLEQEPQTRRYRWVATRQASAARTSQRSQRHPGKQRDGS